MCHPFAGLLAAPAGFAVHTSLRDIDLEEIVAGLNKGKGQGPNPPKGGGTVSTQALGEEGGRGLPLGPAASSAR